MVLRGQTAYIILEDTIMYNPALIDGGTMGNCQYCRVMSDGKLMKYGPDEVSEFQFSDGRLYQRRTLVLDGADTLVFMKRAGGGRVLLHSYRSKGLPIFTLEKDSTIRVQLDPGLGKAGWQDQLREALADCAHMEDAIKRSRYNESSLAALLEIYDRCEPAHIPFPRWGLQAGWAAGMLLEKEFMSPGVLSLAEEFSGGFTAGLFAELPFGYSRFSMLAELNYMQHDYLYRGWLPEQEFYLVANSQVLNLPVNLRMAVPLGKIRLYFVAGPQFAWQLGSDNTLYQASFEGNNVYTEVIASDLLSQFMLGGNLGTGLEVPVFGRKAVYLDLRFSAMDDFQESERFWQQYLLIRAGFSF